MKLAIVGSRSYTDYDTFENVLENYISTEKVTEIVSGGAKGTDSLAEWFAIKNNIPKTIFFAEWSKYGRSAGYIRNEKIWEYCDKGIAFWDGKSPGTKHSINLAKKYGKHVWIIKIP